MPGASRITVAACATRIGRLDVRVRERDEPGLATVDVDEHPFRLPGLAIEVDLANSAQPLPARVDDVAARPFAVVPEQGLVGKLSHTSKFPLQAGAMPSVE